MTSFLDEVGIPPTQRSELLRRALEAVAGAAVDDEMILPVKKDERAIEILESHGITFKENEEIRSQLSEALSAESLAEDTTEEEVEETIEQAMEQIEDSSDDDEPEAPSSINSDLIVDE